MKYKLSNKLKPTPMRPTAFDLFAGCGGLSEGLSRAGFDVRWANEYWKPAAQTYRTSHSATTLFEEDARHLLTRLIDGEASVVSTAIENLKIPAIQCSTCFWALLGI